MMKRSRLLRTWIGQIRAVAVLFIAACLANAPGVTKADQSSQLAPFSVKLAGRVFNNFHYHLTLPAQSKYRAIYNFPPSGAAHGVQAPSAGGPASYFPADLANELQGPVVTTAESHNIYVNCDASCWGDPEAFLRNLGSSSFIKLVDQYVGVSTSNRYTLGASYPVRRTIYNNNLDSNEILAIVDEASKQLGTGYNHVYHVFLPPGVDTCMSQSNQCYSPDNDSTWEFCAYHVSVDLPSNQHVLYTVEPYQVVQGCSVAGNTDSTELNNSTDSSLSHELFETITDPDSNGWLAIAQAVKGQEIGDLCEGKNFPMVLGGITYSVQLEYSNAAHACMKQ